MSGIFSSPKRPKLPAEPERIEPVTAVTDDAERERHRILRTSSSRAATLRGGLANALRKRLGE